MRSHARSTTAQVLFSLADQDAGEHKVGSEDSTRRCFRNSEPELRGTRSLSREDFCNAAGKAGGGLNSPLIKR